MWFILINTEFGKKKISRAKNDKENTHILKKLKILNNFRSQSMVKKVKTSDGKKNKKIWPRTGNGLILNFSNLKLLDQTFSAFLCFLKNHLFRSKT